MHQSFVTHAPHLRGWAGECGANVQDNDLSCSPAVLGKCRTCDITKIYPVEFTLIKSRAMTLSRSLQYRAFSRAVMDEKSSPLFSVGGGTVVTNDWCIIVILPFSLY